MIAERRARSPELRRQFALLTTPVGVSGSGMVRYGAAMFFFLRDELSAETLEIYRRCCNLDDEDPVDLARFEGIAANLPPPPEKER